MKKLLGILVLGLLWSNAAIAEFIELKECFMSEAYGHRNTSKKKISKKLGQLEGHLYL